MINVIKVGLRLLVVRIFFSGIARASEAAQRVKITPREKSEGPFHEISFDAQLKTRTDIAKISLPRASLRYDKFSLEV